MKINHKDFILQTSKEDSVFYTISGQEDFLDEEGNPVVKDGQSDKVYAKAINNRKPREIKIQNNSGLNKISYSFYIKVSPESIPYNPKKLHSVTDNNSLSFVNEKCKSGWFFKEVPKSIFDKYLLFLKTKSIKWLKETQRELK